MLEVLLASSATWQSITNTASVADAREFIHLGEGDNDAKYPRAVIGDLSLTSTAVATGQSSGRGRLYLAFYIKVDISTYRTREARRAWVRSKLGDIRQEMEVVSFSRATPAGYSISHLVLRSIDQMFIPPYERPARDSDIDSDSDIPTHAVWQSEWEVEY